MENDNRDNAFIKFKWREPEDHSSISEDMACATRVRIYFAAKKKEKIESYRVEMFLLRI